MQSLITHFALLSICITLSACSTLPRENHLDAGARQHIKTVDAVLISTQNQINVAKFRTPKTNELLKPMRETLEGYDYAHQYREQIKQSLSGTTLAGVNEIRLVRKTFRTLPSLHEELISKSNADAVLLIDMTYTFTENFEALYVHSSAMLFPNQPKLVQFQEKKGNYKTLELSDNIYRNQFAVGISSGLTNVSASVHAAKWAEMSPEALIEIMDYAGLVLMDGIAGDIGVDDVKSDLNLIPKGYLLNTKYENFNNKFASLRSIDSITSPSSIDKTDAAEESLKTEDSFTPAPTQKPNTDTIK